MNEEWLQVAGYPYEVSSLGRVRRGSRVLKPRPNGQGYLRICASVKGKHTDLYVHRLVCAAFHGLAPSSEMHADHRDGVRSNNAETNLRWLSPQENRARRDTARGTRSGQSKLTEKQVKDIIKVNDATRDRSFATAFSVSRETVRDVRLRKCWRHVSCSV